MAIDIPFGAVDGITAYGTDVNISFGKLMTGGKSIYLFVQNKIKRKTIALTVFGDCNQWIVIGITPDGAALCSGDEPPCYPLEQFSASWTEEPNIIWNTNPVLNGQPPKEVDGTSKPKDLAPALAAECITILGLDANFQVTCKGPDSLTTEDFDVSGFMALMANDQNFKEKPDDPVWNINWRITRSKTDWQTVTRSGNGYVVGGELNTNTNFFADDVPDNCGPLGTCPSHYAVNFTVSARGDRVETQTKTTILAEGEV